MKFGLFYELSVPRPWNRESEKTVYDRCLEQVKLADELGFDSVFAVEHHFLEEQVLNSLRLFAREVIPQFGKIVIDAPEAAAGGQ